MFRSLPFATLSALVHVKPAPESIIYTSAVLRRLQEFGQVTFFQEPLSHRHQNSKGHYFRVCFSSSSEVTRALNNSPFQVKVDHDFTPARVLDPFKVFGFHDKKQWQARTFECDIFADKDEGEHQELQTEYELVIDSRTGPLWKSLREAGVPISLVEGLATVVEKRGTRGLADARRTEILPVEHDDGTTRLDPRPPKLMAMYRAGLREHGDRQSLSAENNYVPITRYFEKSIGGFEGPKRSADLAPGEPTEKKNKVGFFETSREDNELLNWWKEHAKEAKGYQKGD